MTDFTADQEVMTAEEAADRVAQRWRERRDGEVPDTEETGEYTCENCGGHGFNVVEVSDETTTYLHTLECSCGASDDLAASYEYWEIRSYERTGDLESDHQVQWGMSEEELDLVDSGTEDLQVQCEECYERAAEGDWQVEDVTEQDIEVSDEEFWVRCDACDHEIEFGWSHPDRGGRIWPCEASDHNPWKSWPEPRYREAWARRGWLRPGR